jgi:8-oxo-dGTP diphosphatase
MMGICVIISGKIAPRETPKQPHGRRPAMTRPFRPDDPMQAFAGAKLILFMGDDLLVLRRDDRPDIPSPDCWDFPGGGREAGEDPMACALRETREEAGLILSRSDVSWSSPVRRPHGLVWFFAAHLPAARVSDVVFGGEGQGWALMSPDAYCAHPKAIAPFVEVLRGYLADLADKAPLLRKAPRCEGGGR